MSGECDKCGEHPVDCNCNIDKNMRGKMNWNSPKDKLPNDKEIVIIKYKLSEPFFGIARFIDSYSTFAGDYRNIFLIMASPRFPKLWYYTEEYKKISRIPKNKVECWAPLKHPVLTYEDYN